jgi:hypothetical protein
LAERLKAPDFNWGRIGVTPNGKKLEINYHKVAFFYWSAFVSFSALPQNDVPGFYQLVLDYF